MLYNMQPMFPRTLHHISPTPLEVLAIQFYVLGANKSLLLGELSLSSYSFHRELTHKLTCRCLGRDMQLDQEPLRLLAE